MYQSPIRLAGFTQTDFSDKDLQLARKKMLAELELSGQPAVTVQGAKLSGQDIQALFDELADPARRRMHEAIFRDEALRSFLETGELARTDIRLDISRLLNDAGPGFAPIAADAIQALLQRIFRGEATVGSYTAVHHWQDELPAVDADRALHPAFRYYTLRANALDDLLETVKGGVHLRWEDTLAGMNDDLLVLLNELPESFAELRYRIASALNNISVAFERRGRSKDAYRVICKALLVRGGDSLDELMRNNRVIYYRKAFPVRSAFRSFFSVDAPRSSLRYMLLMTVRIGVFVLVLISALSSVLSSLNKEEERAGPAITGTQQPVALDSVQQQNEAAYNTLKKSLLAFSSTDAAHATPVDIPLRLPCDTCAGDAFAAVWRTFFKNEAHQDTAGGGQMLFINELPDMDALVLTNVDSRRFGSLYVKPGQRRIFRYAGRQQAGFSLYIGKDWDSQAWHEFLRPHSGEALDVSYFIRGGFMHVPAVQDYLNPGYDVLARSGIDGKAWRDTVRITADKEGKVQLLIGLDEREL